MTGHQREAVAGQLAAILNDASRVIAATGSCIGEGFDDARQYLGRLHRLQKGNRTVRVCADTHVRMLARRYEKRLGGYMALEYIAEGEQLDDNTLL